MSLYAVFMMYIKTALKCLVLFHINFGYIIVNYHDLCFVSLRKASNSVHAFFCFSTFLAATS